MPDLHPPLASFPFALLIMVVVIEAVLLVKPSTLLSAAKSVNLWAAAVFSLAAFFSGYAASESADRTFKISNELISNHHAYGRLLVFLVWPCAVLDLLVQRSKHGTKIWRASYLIVLTACAVLVIVTGYLGGKLVFEHGAGVSAVLP